MKRLGYIDILRVLANFLIVGVHISIVQNENQTTLLGIERFIRYGLCWSVLPLLFTISGYLIFRGYSYDGFYQKTRNRVIRLLVPYLLWNVCFAALYYVVGVFQGNGSSNSISWYLLRIFGFSTLPACRPLWYLRTLMIYFAISPLLFFLLRRYNKAWGLMVFVCIYLLYGSLLNWKESFPYLFPIYSILNFGVGAYLGLNDFDIMKHVKERKYFLLFIGIISSVGPYVIEFPFAIDVILVPFRALLFFSLIAFLNDDLQIIFCETSIFRILSDSSFFVYASHLGVIEILNPFMLFLNKAFSICCSSVGSIFFFVLYWSIVVCISVFCYWMISRFIPIFTDVLSGRLKLGRR